MSTKVDINLKENEPWVILLTAHDELGEIMPFLSGVEVEFRVNDDDSTLFTQRVGEGIEIVDYPGGVSRIRVTKEEQTLYEISSSKIYFYEARVINGGELSIQAEGRLIIDNSLFSAPEDPLVTTFKLRFPEFDADNAILSMYLSDAAEIVDADDSWSTANAEKAKMYLAAHLLQMRRNAYDQYQSTDGMLTTGAVQSIRIEDRMVMFDRSASSRQAVASKTGLAQTFYGQQYLSMLRRNPIFYKAM